ncbi:MAG: hypothetical protein ACE5GB_09220 [Acidimicrobiales bacterium]
MVLLNRAYLKRYLRFNSIRRGLLGGSRLWLAVLALTYVARWSGKVTKRGEMPVLLSERLRPGEGFVIRHLAPGGR